MTEIQLIDLFDETLRREGVPGHSYLAALLTAALIAAQRDRNGIDLSVHAAELVERAIRSNK